MFLLKQFEVVKLWFIVQLVVKLFVKSIIKCFITECFIDWQWSKEYSIK